MGSEQDKINFMTENMHINKHFYIIQKQIKKRTRRNTPRI